MYSTYTTIYMYYHCFLHPPFIHPQYNTYTGSYLHTTPMLLEKNDDIITTYFSAMALWCRDLTSTILSTSTLVYFLSLFLL